MHNARKERKVIAIGLDAADPDLVEIFRNSFRMMGIPIPDYFDGHSLINIDF